MTESTTLAAAPREDWQSWKVARISEMERAITTRQAEPTKDERAWIAALRGDGAERTAATERLHELLLRAARFEINRRRKAMPHLRGDDFDDLAQQAAGDALMAILAKLDDFRGESRFTTWAFKFALLEAAVKLRRRAWQGRELPVEPERWLRIPAATSSPTDELEHRDLLERLQEAIETELSDRQREVLIAVAVNGVPIDVMAERLSTTRGALYKTIHDARKKLRSAVNEDDVEWEGEEVKES
jgi:RNA polymerase sigma-70 factor (ECF subfamily)